MSPSGNLKRCEESEATCAYALQVLPASEAAAAEAHIASCPDCQRELESLRRVVDRFVSWPTDLLRPATSLQGRLALRIAEDTGRQPVPPPAQQWSEPEWEQVAPGIQCHLLASDTERHRVSMLVRLAPGASYPAHTRAGVEELHLLDGELWIDGRKLVPGDYNYGAPGAGDDSVWSETGCTCVLITSTRDTPSLGKVTRVWITTITSASSRSTQKPCASNTRRSTGRGSLSRLRAMSATVIRSGTGLLWR
jgi:hypothetical protein